MNRNKKKLYTGTDRACLVCRVGYWTTAGDRHGKEARCNSVSCPSHKKRVKDNRL